MTTALAKRHPGRPTKLTPQVQQRIITALAARKPIEEAHALEVAGGELLTDKGRELVRVRVRKA